MKKIITLITIWTISAGIGQCMAQSSNSQAITHWGQSVQGVQLAITMTNNVFQVGSSSVVESVITNSSASFITVFETIPEANSDVVLTSDTGMLYHVTKLPGSFSYRLKSKAIQVGEQQVESIRVTFGDNIEAGDYTIKAIRKFSLSDRDFTLESNSIKVTILK
jgi:hypothetical protein